MFLESFSLPINKEEQLIAQRMYENGERFGYIDNIYPFLFKFLTSPVLHCLS